jgi:hypothetical protein
MYGSSLPDLETLKILYSPQYELLLKLLYFRAPELIKLTTSNFYYVLVNNSEIWHTPDLKETIKHS